MHVNTVKITMEELAEICKVFPCQKGKQNELYIVYIIK